MAGCMGDSLVLSDKERLHIGDQFGAQSSKFALFVEIKKVGHDLLFCGHRYSRYVSWE